MYGSVWMVEVKEMSTLRQDIKKQVISVALITERNVPNKSKLTSDQTVKALMELSHVRLDREHLGGIDNLDCLGPVTNLYLQHNQIQQIENLEMLSKLRFLTLEGNQIRKIEGLKCLLELKFLDLTDNLIENFTTDELPASLIILSLKGNPCTNNPEYRPQLIQNLPNLQQLDGETVTNQERLNVGCAVHSDEEEQVEGEEEEEDEDIDDIGLDMSEKGKGALKEHTDDIIVRAKIRAMKAEAEHENHMEELNGIRNLHAGLMAVSRQGSRPR